MLLVHFFFRRYIYFIIIANIVIVRIGSYYLNDVAFVKYGKMHRFIQIMPTKLKSDNKRMPARKLR